MMEKLSPYSIFTKYIFQNLLIWVRLPSSSKALPDSNVAWGSYSTALLLQDGRKGKNAQKLQMKGYIQSAGSLLAIVPPNVPMINSCHQQGLVYHFSTNQEHSFEANLIFPITVLWFACLGSLQTPTSFFSDEIQVADVCQEHTQCTLVAVPYGPAEWPSAFCPWDHTRANPK